MAASELATVLQPALNLSVWFISTRSWWIRDWTPLSSFSSPLISLLVTTANKLLPQELKKVLFLFSPRNLCFILEVRGRPHLSLRSDQKHPDNFHPNATKLSDWIFAWQTDNHPLKRHWSELKEFIWVWTEHLLPFKSQLELILSSSYDWIYSPVTHFLQRCFRTFSFLFS